MYGNTYNILCIRCFICHLVHCYYYFLTLLCHLRQELDFLVYNFRILRFFPFQDSDASIRKRALELVYLLVNESNVKPLTKELIDYLEVSDQEFKGDLTAKICSIVSK